MPAGAIEQVLNQPLNGAEIKKIIVAKIEAMLAGEGRVTDFAAYRAFRFHCDIGIVLQGAVYDSVERELDGGQGEMLPNPEDETTLLSHVEQGEMPPNEARVDAGIGVPVLTRDERGREVEKTVHYDKSHLSRVKGGQTGAGIGLGEAAAESE